AIQPNSALWPNYRKNKRDANKVDRDGPVQLFPIVSVFAFLKLSDWYRVYRSDSQGGEPCINAKKEPFSTGVCSQSTASAETPLGSTTGGGSPEDTASPQPHR